MAGELSRPFGRLSALICASVALAMTSGTCLLADPSATPAATPSSTPESGSSKGIKLPKGVNGPAYENVRKALEALTPEQRKHFQENFIRWANLSPEEKKELRDREETRKKLMAAEVENSLRDAGLQLDPEHHELYVKRYAEERRKIEEQLRKEMQEKRKPLLKDLTARLKQEFATPATVAATPAPTIAPQNP